MALRLRQLSRSLHLWGALLIFVPVVIVIGSGLLLQVKKQLDWVQPPTQTGSTRVPSIHFEQILAASQQVPQAHIAGWDDIERIDVRPSKGVIKLKSHNAVEIQLDAATAEVLQVAQRRSDTIEAIHDGSWFFDAAKLWVFLPAALVLLILWLSGCVMLYTTLVSRARRRKHQKTRG